MDSRFPGRYSPPFILRSRQRRAAAKSQGTLHATPITADLASSPMECPAPAFLQTLLDCLCATGFRYGLAIVDSALHYHLTTHEELARHFADHGKGRRGIRQAQQTLAYADGRSENGGESIVRAAIIELGFQTPELQIEIEDPMNPGAPKRSDMGWRLPNGRYILVELDGLSKYLSTNARTHEEPSVYQAVRTMRGRKAARVPSQPNRSDHSAAFFCAGSRCRLPLSATLHSRGPAQ